MHRKFIALIISSALAITTVSVMPANANSRDVAKVLAGLAAIAIVSAAISNSNNHRTPPPVSRRYTNPKPTYVPPPVRISPRYVLPGRCQRRINTGYGVRNVLGSHCIANNYAYARSLPTQCAIRFWNGRPRRMVSGYGRACLKQHGYQMSRY